MTFIWDLYDIYMTFIWQYMTFIWHLWRVMLQPAIIPAVTIEITAFVRSSDVSGDGPDGPDGPGLAPHSLRSYAWAVSKGERMLHSNAAWLTWLTWELLMSLYLELFRYVMICTIVNGFVAHVFPLYITCLFWETGISQWCVLGLMHMSISFVGYMQSLPLPNLQRLRVEQRMTSTIETWRPWL